MSGARRTPPGRAGRLWLRRRIDAAERGREELDHKLRILLPEHERLRAEADRRAGEWQAACRQAQQWLLRMGLLSGESAVRLAVGGRRADVRIGTVTSMGVAYPAGVSVTVSGGASALDSNAAVAPAVAAFRAALVAGAEAATATEAARRLAVEIEVTRRRMRALDRRWLPELRGYLRTVELSLQQDEQDDAARLRRAVGRPRP